VASGERGWRLAPGEEHWGIFKIPEADLHLLPNDPTGLDAIELGCGTAYVGAWLARRGARVVGIDNSLKQLEMARDI
jgi:2-polyprenyl-3-methyl-5-hydroxy-6-metoxy-1,4-benzoquinol methylase